jgi:hypothetical protein
LFWQGNEYYSAGEYALAASFYARAHELTHEPELLFNIAQAHRMANDCGEARLAFERYRAAASEPAPAAANWLQELRQTCPEDSPGVAPETAVGAAAPVEPAVQSPAPIDPGVKSPAPVAPESQRSRPRLDADTSSAKRTWGWASAGAALGSAIGGLWLARAANQTEQELDAQARGARQMPGSVSWEQLDRLERKGQMQNAWTVGLFGAAAVLAGVSVTLFATQEPEHRTRAELELELTGSHAAWTIRGVY